MNLFGADIFFAIGIFFWVIACLLLAILQVAYRIKYGRFKSLFKEVTGGYLTLAKVAGLSFLIGTAIIVIGFILR